MKIIVAPPPPCFVKGTRILTPNGETPVEHLAIGDQVTTHAGRARTIRWIGRRSFTATTGRWPKRFVPVRIRRGALGPDCPHCDLFLSPSHMIFFDGVLVPVEHLVDGESIAPVPPAPNETVSYLHVELEDHDLLVSEGVPTGSLRAGPSKRERFGNFAEYAHLYPDDRRDKPAPCAEIVPSGVAKMIYDTTGTLRGCARIEAIRQKLAERSSEIAAGPSGNAAEPVTTG